MARVDYDRMAPAYQEARSLSLEGLAGWREAVSPYLPPPNALPAVDVGSGTGVFAKAFATWFSCEVIAVEPSDGMRAQAEANRPHPLVHYVPGNAMNLPVADSSCGAAWLSTVVHHIADLSAAARELRRVLVPGAPILIRSSFPGRHDGITLFRFFPEASRVAATFPSVESTVTAFGTAGFAFESLQAVPQVTAPNLATTRERILLRADTTLQGLADAEFERGLARLDAAIAADETGAAVVDYLDLLVLR
jgi:ubiquinone/menaquinone biosynthesis C-methylase UbiE